METASEITLWAIGIVVSWFGLLGLTWLLFRDTVEAGRGFYGSYLHSKWEKAGRPSVADIDEAGSRAKHLASLGSTKNNESTESEAS